MRKYIINPFTGLLDCIGVDTPVPPVEEYITFADPEVERICIENWSSDGIGLTYEDAAAVIFLDSKFGYYSENPPTQQITSFNELQYFTSLNEILGGEFMGAEILTSIILPNSINSIGYGAFSDCFELTKIIIPESVTSIGYNCFNGCPKLNSVNIPKTIDIINYMTFAGCSKLTSITLPDSILKIEDAAFFNCSSLTSIIIKSIIPPVLPEIPEGLDIFNFFSGCNSLVNIFVPAASVDVYKSAAGWSYYAELITAIVE